MAGSSDNREASIGLEIVYAPSPPPPRFQLINETNTTANVTPSAMTGIAAYIAAGGITSPSILLDEEIGATMFGCAGENLAPGSPDTPLSASLQLGAAGLNLPADSRCDAVVAQTRSSWTISARTQRRVPHASESSIPMTWER